MMKINDIGDYEILRKSLSKLKVDRKGRMHKRESIKITI